MLTPTRVGSILGFVMQEVLAPVLMVAPGLAPPDLEALVGPILEYPCQLKET